MAAPGARVDETDCRILSEIFVGEGAFWRSDRVPLEAVARRLGLHRNTVSARVRRLAARRIFLPATLEFEPGRLGLVAAMAFMEVPREARTPATREALLALDGVQALWEYAEGWSVLAFAETADALTGTLRAAERLSRPRTVTLDLDSARDYPPFEPLALTKLDVRLVERMLDDSRSAYRALGRELGIPAMTLKRRYDRLSRLGAVCLVPGGEGPADGMTLGHLIADLPEDPVAAGRVARDLLAALPGQLFRNLTSPRRAHVILYAASLRELEARLEAARALTGVRAATLRTFAGIRASPAWRPWIARVLAGRAAPEPARPPPSPRARRGPSGAGGGVGGGAGGRHRTRPGRGDA